MAHTVPFDEYTYDNLAAGLTEQAWDQVMHQLHSLLLKRFPSEHNHNTYDEAYEALQGYVQIPNDQTMWPGRYVRYLDCTDPYAITLKTGGHLMSDRRSVVQIKQSPQRVFRVRKRNRVWYMLPNDNDLRRVQFQQWL